MPRIFVEILLPLALPTIIYLAWVWFAHRLQPGETVRWAALPWVWLAGIGVVLLAAMLLVVTVGFGTPQKGAYVPPYWRNGRIVPGHIDATGRK